MQDTQQTTPLEAVIEGDTKVELGDEAKTALRREYIRKLHESLIAVREAEQALPQLDEAAARGALEQLGIALRDADSATSVLWWLAPGDEA